MSGGPNELDGPNFTAGGCCDMAVLDVDANGAHARNADYQRAVATRNRKWAYAYSADDLIKLIHLQRPQIIRHIGLQRFSMMNGQYHDT
jgi:hypothetical protein